MPGKPTVCTDKPAYEAEVAGQFAAPSGDPEQFGLVLRRIVEAGRL